MQINCKQKKIAFKPILMTYQILAMTMGMTTNILIEMMVQLVETMMVIITVLIIIAMQVQQIVQHQTSK